MRFQLKKSLHFRILKFECLLMGHKWGTRFHRPLTASGVGSMSEAVKRWAKIADHFARSIDDHTATRNTLAMT